MNSYLVIHGVFALFILLPTLVPMCPAFNLTDYKVQGSTLTTAVLDLKHDLRVASSVSVIAPLQ